MSHRVSATLRTIVGDERRDLHSTYLKQSGVFCLVVCSQKSQIELRVEVDEEGEISLAKADFTGPGENN
jgi:hypothetical protein